MDSVLVLLNGAKINAKCAVRLAGQELPLFVSHEFKDGTSRDTGHDASRFKRTLEKVSSSPVTQAER